LFWLGCQTNLSVMSARGSLLTLMSAQMPEDKDRYAMRPADPVWCVWDTLRDELVFGAERVTEGQARALARRLNDAYRQVHQASSGTSDAAGR
jgi:hypothetical protein